MKHRNLPLGVDIGTTRVRVLHAVATPEGPRVQAVAVRNTLPGTADSGRINDPDSVAGLLAAAVAELRTTERRCVACIGEPDAMLRPFHIPKMTAAERERAAGFEAQRFIEFPASEAVVRVHRGTTAGDWILGIANARVIETRLATLRRAGLRPLALDHEACALTRALPEFDAVVDVGHHRASIHVAGAVSPSTFHVYSGGADITSGIVRELSIDQHTAEKRKRILGTSGAGERARVTLTSDIASLITAGRRTRAISRLALLGNASRLHGLSSELQSATGAICETAVPSVLRAGVYPDDVVRSGAADWSLAAGLALWVRR